MGDWVSQKAELHGFSAHEVDLRLYYGKLIEGRHAI
jgi:hypothetical protein